MNSESESFVAGRFVGAYAAMVAVSTLLYSAVSYGSVVEPIRLLLVCVFSLLFSTLIALPVALIGARVGYRRNVLALIVFMSVFVLFFIWNVVEMAASTQLVVGPRSLVLDGEITGAGYWIAARDSLITAFVGLVGFSAFIFIAPLSLLSSSRKLGRTDSL